MAIRRNNIVSNYFVADVMFQVLQVQNMWVARVVARKTMWYHQEQSITWAPLRACYSQKSALYKYTDI